VTIRAETSGTRGSALAAGWVRVVRLPPVLVDTTIAVLILAEGVLQLHFEPVPLPGIRNGALPYAMLVLKTLPLALRRRAPLPVFLIIMAAAVSTGVLRADVPNAEQIAILIALYTVVERSTLRLALLALVPFVPHFYLLGRYSSLPAFKLFIWNENVPPIIACWLAGRVRHRRHALSAKLTQRAEQLEEERGRLARLALARERGLIASDLKVLVAAGIQSMADRARFARELMARGASDAEAVLAGIESRGRDVVAEMGRLLRVLRRSKGDAGAISTLPPEGEPVTLTDPYRFGEKRTIDPRLADVLIVTGVGLSMAIEFKLRQWFGASTGILDVFDPKTALLAALTGIALLFRRQAPFLVVLVIGVDMAVQVPLGAGSLVTSFWCQLIALYGVGAYRRPRWAVAAVALSMASLINSPGETPLMVVIDQVYEGALFALASYAGWSVQQERRSNDALRRRTAELDQTRQQRVRLAIQEERRRVARDMHDMVAHAVTLMVIQAGAARSVAGSDPALAAEMVAGIERAGQEAAGEMQRMLGTLGRGGEGEPPTGLPALQDVSGIALSAREAGLEVELHVEGEPRPLRPGLDLAAYRIIQEGLTNVRKHAPGSRASVILRYLPTSIEVEVENDAGRVRPGEPRLGGGHGLIGIRERASVFGGESWCGPMADGGFQVSARLPFDPEASGEAVFAVSEDSEPTIAASPTGSS
jgi:signal transduction histidine kinase